MILKISLYSWRSLKPQSCIHIWLRVLFFCCQRNFSPLLVAWYGAQSIICFALVFAPSPSHPSSVAPRQRRLFLPSLWYSSLFKQLFKPLWYILVVQTNKLWDSSLFKQATKRRSWLNFCLAISKQIHSRNLCHAANGFVQNVFKRLNAWKHIYKFFRIVFFGKA